MLLGAPIPEPTALAESSAFSSDEAELPPEVSEAGAVTVTVAAGAVTVTVAVGVGAPVARPTKNAATATHAGNQSGVPG